MRGQIFIGALVAASVIGFSATGARAQAPTGQAGKAGKPGQAGKAGKPGRGNRGMGMRKIAEQLDLTAEQKQKLQTLLSEGREKRKAIAQDSALTSEQKTAKLKELEKSNRETVEKMLTPEQKTRFKELQEKARAEGRARRAAEGKKPATKP